MISKRHVTNADGGPSSRPWTDSDRNAIAAFSAAETDAERVAAITTIAFRKDPR